MARLWQRDLHWTCPLKHVMQLAGYFAMPLRACMCCKTPHMINAKSPKQILKPRAAASPRFAAGGQA